MNVIRIRVRAMVWGEVRKEFLTSPFGTNTASTMVIGQEDPS
jgi:hypothetical protein